MMASDNVVSIRPPLASIAQHQETVHAQPGMIYTIGINLADQSTNVGLLLGNPVNSMTARLADCKKERELHIIEETA